MTIQHSELFNTVNKLNTLSLTLSGCSSYFNVFKHIFNSKLLYVSCHCSHMCVCSQAFVEYQQQKMTSDFVEQFGFNEDEFAEQEECIG